MKLRYLFNATRVAAVPPTHEEFGFRCATKLTSHLDHSAQAPHVIGEIAAPGRQKSKGKGEAWVVSYSGALSYSP